METARRSALLAVAISVAIAVPLAAAAGWPGPPVAKPPQPAGGGPPTAWIESASQSRWLAYGDYCWASRCVNYDPPALRDNIAAVRHAARGMLRITFAFAPRTVSVGYIQEGAPPRPLTPGRIVLWRSTSSGRFEIQITAAHGSASYVGAVELTR